MRGSSGARIIIGDDHVTKFDVHRTGTRVREQGIWLRNHESKLLPEVKAIHSDGYTMEKLEDRPLPRTVEDVRTGCELLIDHLPSLWDTEQSFIIKMHAQTHHNYVDGLLRDVDLRELRKELRQIFNHVFWPSLRIARTHGDPLIDNTMFRSVEGSRTGMMKPVLIDPIPATTALPHLQVVDIGRVIQSAIGYEWTRYDVGPHAVIHVPEAVDHVINAWQSDRFSMHEVIGALYFSIIHMIRGIRTAPESKQPGLVDLVYKLLEEVDRWTR